MTDREHAELLVLYHRTGEDIDRTRREQWWHYSAVMGAMFGVSGLSALAFCTPEIESAQVIIAVLLALFIIGVTLLTMHQVRLYHLQRFVDRCVENFEPQTKSLCLTRQSGALYRLLVPALLASTMLLVFGFLVMTAVPGSEEEQEPLPAVAVKALCSYPT